MVKDKDAVGVRIKSCLIFAGGHISELALARHVSSRTPSPTDYKVSDILTTAVDGIYLVASSLVLFKFFWFI
jgi:hypothetical protein